jgi:hypothetical protein
VKTLLVGQILNEPEDLRKVITAFLDEVQPSELDIVFSDWIERVQRGLENNGDDDHE